MAFIKNIRHRWYRMNAKMQRTAEKIPSKDSRWQNLVDSTQNHHFGDIPAAMPSSELCPASYQSQVWYKTRVDGRQAASRCPSTPCISIGAELEQMSARFACNVVCNMWRN